MKNKSIVIWVILTGLILSLLFNCKKETVKTAPLISIPGTPIVTGTTATIKIVIDDNGGAEVTERGICWGTKDNPTINDNKAIAKDLSLTEINHTRSVVISDNNSVITGDDNTISISDLNPNTTYYVKAYAINPVGVGYSKQLILKTLALIPVLTTLDLTNITSTSASSGGIITSDGGDSITARGICWSTSQDPTISDSKSSDGIGKGSFTSQITGLAVGTTYYFRAYATNSIGTAYGNELTLATVGLSNLTTASISFTSNSTATCGGDIQSDGGAPVTARGVCWSSTQNPTILDNKTSDGSGTGSFTSNITGLTAGRSYYFRAYATNSAGTSYGNQIFGNPSAILPTLTTTTVTSITATTGSSGGIITNDGGASVTGGGICWSTNQNPTISDSRYFASVSNGSFTCSLGGLTPATTYYVRAFASNYKGMAYGNQVSFTTLALPVLHTTAISIISSTAAATGGSISHEGGSPVTAKGVCWSTNQNPTIADNKTNNGSGKSSFTSTVSPLIPGTIYYVRAYATNSTGTSYGNQVIANTGASLPTLTTTVASAITATKMNSGGNITSDGGATVTSRGICWSTSQNPTLADSHSGYSTGTGSWVSVITNLTPATTYYIRAFATNTAGTIYGNQVSATTYPVLPVLTTKAVSAFTYSALCGGVVSSVGIGTMKAGVCWSLNPNPTINDNKTIDCTGVASYTSTLTGLAANTTYYIRAYGTNDAGTIYGEEFSFKTGNPTIPSADYLPLQVGNYWELADKSTTLTMLIDKIENLDGIDYYRMIKRWNSYPKNDTLYFRKTVDGKIYDRAKTTSEIIKFDLSVSQGDKWVYPIEPLSTINSPWTVTLLSKTDTVRRSNYTFENCYTYLFDQVQCADEESLWYLAPGFGFVVYRGLNWGYWVRLKKVKINGIETVY